MTRITAPTHPIIFCCIGIPVCLVLSAYLGAGWVIQLLLLPLLYTAVFLWRLIATLMDMGRRRTAEPRYALSTLSPSHFAEKIAWIMDLADIPYERQDDAGVWGAFLLGRSIPTLRLLRSGSHISDSEEIVRYLAGECPSEHVKSFFDMSPEARELEARIGKLVGVAGQMWGYNKLLAPEYKHVVAAAWSDTPEGCPPTPVWQRAIVTVCGPLFMFFMKAAFQMDQVTEKQIPEGTTAFEKGQEYINEMFDEIGERLKSHPFIMGSHLTHIDITFAALSSISVHAEEFPGLQLKLEELPECMVTQIEKWRAHPAGVHALKMYRLYRSKTLSVIAAENGM